MLDLLLVLLGHFFVLCGVIPADHQISLTKELSERFHQNMPKENYELHWYFMNNKELIRSKYLLHHPSEEGQACSAAYLALLHKNYEMACWLCDNGCEMLEAADQELFIKRAIEKDFEFNNKHIQQLFTRNPDIITKQCIYERLDGKEREKRSKEGFKGELFTPLQYATILENQKALVIMKNKLGLE